MFNREPATYQCDFNCNNLRDKPISVQEFKLN